MRTRRTVPLIMLLGMLILALGACAAQRSESTSMSVAENKAVPPMPAAAPAMPPARDAAAGGQTTTSNAYSQTDTRMIVRTGEMSVVVPNVEGGRSALEAMATALGGYVSNTDLRRTGENLQGTVTLRIPSSRFNEALDQVSQLGKVEARRLNSNDVTEQYTDLDARLRNLQATERELLTLLTSIRERSGKAEDILAVYRELTDIRGQIEQLQGRINYLKSATDLATLTVTLLPSPATRPVVEDGWAPLETLRAASRALVRTFQGLGNAAIWAIVWGLPVAVVVGIPLWFVWRWLRRRTIRVRPQPGT